MGVENRWTEFLRTTPGPSSGFANSSNRSLAVENGHGTQVSDGNPCSHLVFSLRASPIKPMDLLDHFGEPKLTYPVRGLVPPAVP